MMTELPISESNYELLPRKIIKSPFEKIVTSYGIIAYAALEKKWLIVHRKHSPSYTTILRTGYRDSSLRDLASNMVDREVKKLTEIVNAEPSQLNNILIDSYTSVFNIPPDKILLEFMIKRFRSPVFRDIFGNPVNCLESPEW